MSAQEDSPGIYSAATKLGQVAAIASAVLITPWLYEWSRIPLSHYLAKTYGAEITGWLILGLGVLEAFAIYTCVAMLTTFALIWLLAFLAARGFGR